MKQKIQSLVAHSCRSRFPLVQHIKHTTRLLFAVLGVSLLVGCGAMTSATSSSSSESLAIATRQSLAYQELTWTVTTVPNQNFLDISVSNSSDVAVNVRFSKSPLSGRIVYHGADGVVLGEEPLGILSTIAEYEIGAGNHWIQRIELQSLPAEAASMTVEIVCQVSGDAPVTETLEMAISQ